MESKAVTEEGIDAAGEAHANGTPCAGVPEATTGADWEQAHNELVRLAHTRAGLDGVEAHWLLVALRSGAHRRLGFASFLEYLERLFGYSPRFGQERLRVAEALEALPALRAALSEGVLSWSVVRELSRVATGKTEAEWLHAARGRSVREVEHLVSGRRPGDAPGDPPDRAARRHVIRLEVAAEAFALFREAMGKLRRDAGGPLDDDDAVLMMARQVLGGPSDAGRGSYQVALTVCEKCRHAEQQGCGEPISVGPEVAEMAGCDALVLPTHVGAETGMTNAGTETTGTTHVGVASSPKRARATQAIPPAVRRSVMTRDGQRCVVPGCRHATWIDVHHIDPKAEGGDHDPENLVCVCGAHHMALHRGDLVIEGRVSAGLSFRHADGTPYGGTVSPHAAEVHSSVFRAMRGLGFKESDARRAVERAAAHVGQAASAETLLRAALGDTQRRE
jgi:hypothetical protein